MSTATINRARHPSADVNDAINYRAIHIGAIVGFLIGLASVAVLLSATTTLEACLLVTPIPIIGMFISLRAWAKIRREREQYTGAPLAAAGFALSLFFLLSGVGYGYYVYATEVPEGYERVSFETLRPSELDERSGHLIPPEVLALNGKRVFIKGYIRPGSAPVRTGIDRFLLVRDNNQCCFGDLSKVKFYDQMAVHITSKDRVDDTLKILRMGGILEVNPENLEMGLGGAPVFTLKADYAVQ